eukprot:492548-Pelagomonas_calceolata.AAC.1
MKHNCLEHASTHTKVHLDIIPHLQTPFHTRARAHTHTQTHTHTHTNTHTPEARSHSRWCGAGWRCCARLPCRPSAAGRCPSAVPRRQSGAGHLAAPARMDRGVQGLH